MLDQKIDKNRDFHGRLCFALPIALRESGYYQPPDCREGYR